MVDLNALNVILSTRNGVWASFMVLTLIAWRGWQYIPAIMAAWVARRQVIAAEKDADWTRRSGEIQRLAARVDTLEHKEEDCQAELRDALGRLAQVEGFMMGQGKARQEAAAIVAVERLTDRNGDKGGSGK